MKHLAKQEADITMVAREVVEAVVEEAEAEAEAEVW